jgi:hypothetical protein
MNFLRPLNRTGHVVDVWIGADGYDVDITAVDPRLTLSYTASSGKGRNCVGIYVGSAGSLVLEVPTYQVDGYGVPTVKNVFFVGLQAGTYLPVRASKILASGTVADASASSAGPTGGSGAKTSTAHDLIIYYEV